MPFAWYVYKTYMLHWILIVIDFELYFMITYYYIQCLNVTNNIWYLIIYYIGLYQNTISSMILPCITIILFMFVYRQKSWVILHILMRYLRRLIFARVMVNSLMKDQEGQSWVTFVIVIFLYFSRVIYIYIWH